tara:strand:- start:1867 stop:2775 length:909 start_codon:yes stop_codon:yes gene_type:complete
MNNEITTLDTNNFEAMSQLMGMDSDITQKKQASTLSRLKIQHSPIMGEIVVKGKKTQAAVVNGGVYKLDDLEKEKVYYASAITIRPYLQRFMYKKFVKPDNERGFYVKTVMSDNLNMDLKDNTGGFNCGKPTGYIKDYNALPDATKQLIKGIKRVRVLFGTVMLHDAVDENGDEIVFDMDVPFIWEIDNRDAFKIMGEPISKIGSWKHILIQHGISLGTEEKKLPNGSSFYLPTYEVLPDPIDIGEDEQKIFEDFVQWIKNYNTYIFNIWTEKAKNKNDGLSDEDMNVVDDFVDVELDSNES